MNKKVTKNRCFLSKTAVFLVDDTGLEPVTFWWTIQDLNL